MNSTEFEHIISQTPTIGSEMYQLMVDLYPICRSITGNGVRESLEIISKHIPLEIHEVPTGTKVFDWTIPKEWNIRDAYVISPSGEKIIDFKKSNLHVVNYSTPINKKISLQELKNHLHTRPDNPDVIPYVTSYYEEAWGFCLSYNEYVKLTDGEYHVVIDSSLENGSLTYGEYFLGGKTDEEILLTCYICHPSMCNDNLSGVVLLTMLAKYLSKTQKFYSIRFLFIPETIGAITWLSLNENKLHKIKHGLVATWVGNADTLTYKKTRQGNAEIDKVVLKILKNSNSQYNILDFFPWGSDERQFCSPAFDLPVGSLTRSLYDRANIFPEYHTSADNLELVKKESLNDSFSTYLSIIYALEQNNRKTNTKVSNENKIITNSKKGPFYLNLNPKCEPHLSKRGLYNKFGATKETPEEMIDKFALLWLLNLSDGKHSLSDIANRSGLEIRILKKAANYLLKCGLLKILE